MRTVYGNVKWVIDCPYCGEKHVHSIQAEGWRMSQWWRMSHCEDKSKRQPYIIKQEPFDPYGWVGTQE